MNEPNRDSTAPLDDAGALKWDSQGLITAVAQDRLTGQVRMVAWMNREALEVTLASGEAVFYSRSRKRLWRKGESSGHVLVVREVLVDCDGDTLLLLVDPLGPSCHTGRPSCFFQTLRSVPTLPGVPTLAELSSALRERDAGPFLSELEDEIASRAHSTAERSYTRSLLDGGVERISDKISEEAAEVGEALRRETDERVANEAADVIYHLLVGLRARGVPLRKVIEVLASRSGRSGHAEKASRRPPAG